MMNWLLELPEFDIHYEFRKALKAPVFADFVVKMIFPAEVNKKGMWTVYVNRSSNSKGSGVGMIIESDEGLVI
jgi:hypothetical protein